uniref:Protein YIPF n=1 Tax=Odontella aurita TaxID=265563 RepID=A0A7S4IZH5_9STRA
MRIEPVGCVLGEGQDDRLDSQLMEDTDLVGPLCFALLLGGEMMLAGKLNFGYIYGFGLFGTLALALVMNLMSPADAISVWTVISILGYALLPVNVLAGMNAMPFLRIKNLGALGMILSATTVIWCTMASTRLFERGCGMRDQRYLVAYPTALFYSAFVIITIF